MENLIAILYFHLIGSGILFAINLSLDIKINKVREDLRKVREACIIPSYSKELNTSIDENSFGVLFFSNLILSIIPILNITNIFKLLLTKKAYSELLTKSIEKNIEFEELAKLKNVDMNKVKELKEGLEKTMGIN